MAHWGGVEERELDQRNQMRSLTLSNKVSQLKSIAVDLEHESHEHNRLLDGLDGDFGSGDTLLAGSMNRLRGVFTAGSKNRKVMCYTSFFVVLFFILFFYSFSSLRSSS